MRTMQKIKLAWFYLRGLPLLELPNRVTQAIQGCRVYYRNKQRWNPGRVTALWLRGVLHYALLVIFDPHHRRVQKRNRQSCSCTIKGYQNCLIR